MNVLPHVQLGPIGDRKDANALALVDFGVVEIPQFRTLVLRIPAVTLVTERIDSFFGAGFFFVTSSSAKRRIELILVQRLFQPVRFHDLGVLSTLLEWIQIQLEALLIDVCNHIQTKLLASVLLTELVHVLKLPGRVHVQ